MAWTRNADGAVELINAAGESAWLGTSSKCTVNLYSVQPSPVDALRMFGISAGDADKSTAAEGVVFTITEPVAAALISESDDVASIPLCYLDAVDDGGRLRFILEEGTSGARTLQATAIPTQKTAVEWYYTHVIYGTDKCETACDAVSAIDPEDYGDDLYSVTNLRDVLATFDVKYGDPAVILLPEDKGWLMVLSRVRSKHSDAPGEVASSYLETLSDIVAYVARPDDPGFTDTLNIKGPFWIANSIGTLGPDSYGIRLWLSVPGAAMITPEILAVYFVVEVAGINCWSVCGNVAEKERAQEAIAPFDRAGASVFEACIGVHRIVLDDLLGMDYGNERDWALIDDGSSTYVNYLVAREKSKLFLWRDDGSGTLTELVDVSDYVKIADPQLCSCSLDAGAIGELERLRLFIAAIEHTPPGAMIDDWIAADPELNGLWMATPMGDATVPDLPRPDGSLSASIPGVDFLLTGTTAFEPPTVGLPSVKPGEPEPNFALPLDPDPVRLSDGTWRVYFGLKEGWDPDVTENPFETWFMGETDNSDAEVCGTAPAAAPPAIGKLRRTPVLVGRRADIRKFRPTRILRGAG